MAVIIKKEYRYNRVYNKRTAQNGAVTTEDVRSTSSIDVQNGIISKGGPIPFWQERIRSGVNATTELSAVGFRLKWAPSLSQYSQTGNIPVINDKQALEYQSSHFDPPVVQTWGPVVSSVEADNAAIASVIKNARQAQSSFMGGVFVGELREALRMLRPSSSSLFRGMQTYLDGVRNIGRGFSKRMPPSSRRNERKRDYLKAVSDAYLEYSFGWRPAINDVVSARKELIRIMNDRREVRRVKGGGRNESLTYSYNWGSVTNPYAYTYYHLKRKNSVDVRFKAAVICKSGAQVPAVAEKLGFTVSQFVPTIYELIPYSFLVDYFSNLGDIVSCVSFPRSDLVYCVRGYQWLNTTEYVGGAAGKTQVVGWDGNGSVSYGQSKLEQFGKTRQKYTGPLVPSLEFKVPGLPRQGFNLAALATSMSRARGSFHL